MPPIHPALQFWVTYLRHSDVFGKTLTEDLLIVELKTFRQLDLLTLLSKINLLLQNEPRQNRDVQPALCTSFFPAQTRAKLDATARRFKKNDPTERTIVVFHQFQIINLIKLALLHCTDDFGTVINSEEERWRFGLCCLMMNDLLTPEVEATAGQEHAEIIENIIRASHAAKEDRFGYGLARAYELFVEIPKQLRTHPQFYDFPTMFERATGFSVEDYLALGFSLFTWWADVNLTTVMSSSHTYLHPERFFERSQGDRKKFDRIFKLFSLSADACREELVKEKALLPEAWQFRYCNVTLEKYPLIRTEAGLICASMRFLQAKLTRNVFYMVSNVLPAADTKRYRDFFGRVFEQYVRRVLERTFATRSLIAHYGASHEEAGEAVIVYPRVLMIFEAKSSRLSLDLNRSGDPAKFRQALESIVVAGCKQMERVIQDFKEGRFTIPKVSHYEIGRFYPVLVTIEALPQEYFTRRQLDELIAQAGVFLDLSIAPLTLLSIEELEYLEPLLRTLTLVEILGDKAGNDGFRDISMKNYLYLTHGELPKNEALEARFEEITEYLECLLQLKDPKPANR